MIDPRLAWFAGFSTGVAFTGGLAGWFRRRKPPYSSAAIVFRATQEDADRVRSKIVNPLAWEDPPEPMTVEEWARRYGNRDDDRLDSLGLQRPPIKPQFPAPRVIPGDTP